MEWAQILVILLSVLLSLLLIAAIVLVIQLIRITRKINEVVESAQRIAATVEETTVNVARVTSPVWLARALSSSVKRMFRSRKS